jgi:predicted ATP-grasp superfamily ATP-dependent carboligase
MVKDFMAGRKGFVARNKEELAHIAASLPESESTWVLQEIIPGSDAAITLFGAYFDRQSRAHQSFTCRKLRQFPPGFGSASMVRSATLEDTRRLSEDFLRDIGYSGIAGAEFKLDPRDGKLKIIEINPRPTLWFGAAHHAGKRIALAAFCDLANLPLPEVVRPSAASIEGREYRRRQTRRSCLRST